MRSRVVAAAAAHQHPILHTQRDGSHNTHTHIRTLSHNMYWLNRGVTYAQAHTHTHPRRTSETRGFECMSALEGATPHANVRASFDHTYVDLTASSFDIKCMAHGIRSNNPEACEPYY